MDQQQWEKNAKECRRKDTPLFNPTLDCEGLRGFFRRSSQHPACPREGKRWCCAAGGGDNRSSSAAGTDLACPQGQMPWWGLWRRCREASAAHGTSPAAVEWRRSCPLWISCFWSRTGILVDALWLIDKWTRKQLSSALYTEINTFWTRSTILLEVGDEGLGVWVVIDWGDEIK